MKNGKPFPIPVRSKPAVQYNCLKCPGYCCTYTEIEITTRDIERLAMLIARGELERACDVNVN